MISKQSEIIKLDQNKSALRDFTIQKIYNKEYVHPAFLAVTDLEIYSKDKSFISKVNRGMRTSALDERIELTTEQEECLEILEKTNLFISAPTSFGKTYIALEYIARNIDLLNNIVFVVPTIALMNELRKKCYAHFGGAYYMITSDSELEQYVSEKKKIFILVPERVSTIKFKNYFENNLVDFMIYDEIYKLGFDSTRKQKDNSRQILMNYIYSFLLKISKKILLLGPFIKDVDFDRSNIEITKYITNLNLICNEIMFDETFTDFIGSPGDKRFVYFSSPDSIKKFLNQNENVTSVVSYDQSIIEWMIQNVHPDWYYIDYLQNGIGIHHGKTPIFLRKYIENEYANGYIHTILCTSTLIEGINTPTLSLVIHDAPRGGFELNNLIGRVGRLNTDNLNKGKVYIKDKKIFEMFKLDHWIELKILYEQSEIISQDKEDESLYLDKKSDSVTESKIQTLKEMLKTEFSIDYEEVLNRGIEFNLLKAFVAHYDRIIGESKESKVINDFKYLLFKKYNRYLDGLMLKKYSFGDKESEHYLSIDPVYLLLNSRRGFKPVIDAFILKYPKSNKQDINQFIDTLFQVDEFIKFQLSKIISIYELFNDKFLINIRDNRAFIQAVGLIKSYGSANTSYERILEDMGFPNQDMTIIVNEIMGYCEIKGTEQKLKRLKQESSVYDKLSPFGRKILDNIK